jgi:hypothetical protein
MDFYLHRTYYKMASHGALFHKGQFLCFCLELPWLPNDSGNSCIPDGTYEMETFYSPEYRHHLLLKNVFGRKGILIRPIIDGSEDLGGIIAPMAQLTGLGKGLGSQNALNRVLMRIEAFREEHEALFLTICSEFSGR